MYLFKHAHLIIDGNREYLDGAVLIDSERIKEVYPQSDKIKEISGEYETIDLDGQIVMPGYFDTHSHGSCGICFDDCNLEGMDKVAKDFLLSGTTSYLSSLSYDLNHEDRLKQLSLFEDYEGTYSHFMGIHLEGPFLSNKHIGVGKGERFVKPDLEMTKQFLDHSTKIKQMTIAYELDGAKEIGKYLHDNDIRVMCGHSDALYEDLDDNVDGFTHLFNAMRSLHHRDRTLVNCAFMGKWYVEIICDGIHINTDVLKLVFNNIDKDKIILVSDSSLARNMPDGEYTFMSKKCLKKDGAFITDDGHYAGSTASLNDELKLLYGMGIKYTDLLIYSSLNAFRFYGLDKEYGTIEKGKYADLVISDDDLNINMVLCRGNIYNV